MPLAYSYVRMSTERQIKGDSLRRQNELSAAYAEKHGLTLVTDFELHDLGVSAFKGANAVTGALGRFLQAIQEGNIPKGSYLLVESLDRLSRDKVTSAMHLFLQITESGVNIVTLSDDCVYKAGNTDFPQMITSLVVMSRANEESLTKSKRVGAAWSNKRTNAGSKKLTRLCPAWLSLDHDRHAFSIVPGRDDIVRSLFEKCAEGHGSNSLTRELNARQVPVFGRSTRGWNESYVTKILQNRAVLGEFQPHSVVDSKRMPAGDVIADYFPRIVEDDLFLRVQAARRGRTTGAAGRKGDTVSNLFSNIAKCEYCGASMRMVNKGTGPKGGRYLRCSASVQGMGCVATGWRYANFETSFLLFTQEVDLAAVLTATADNTARAQLIQRQAAALERIRDLTQRRQSTFELNIAQNTTFLASKLLEYESLLAAAEADLVLIEQQLTASTASPVADPSEIQTQIEVFRSFKGADAFAQRSRLAAKLRAIVTSLTVAVDGKLPQIEKTKQMLLASEPDEHYRAQLLKAIDEGYRDANAYHPTFQVIFADGTSRRVVVDKNDAAKWLVEAVIDTDGDAIVRNGRAKDWVLSRPATDGELDEILSQSVV